MFVSVVRYTPEKNCSAPYNAGFPNEWWRDCLSLLFGCIQNRRFSLWEKMNARVKNGNEKSKPFAASKSSPSRRTLYGLRSLKSDFQKNQDMFCDGNLCKMSLSFNAQSAEAAKMSNIQKFLSPKKWAVHLIGRQIVGRYAQEASSQISSTHSARPPKFCAPSPKSGRKSPLLPVWELLLRLFA